MLNFEGSPSDTALLRSSRLPGALRAAPGPAAAAKHKALLREPGTKVARLALWQSPSKRCPSSKGCVSSSAFRNLQHLPDFLKSDRTTAAGRPHLDTAPPPPGVPFSFLNSFVSFAWGGSPGLGRLFTLPHIHHSPKFFLSFPVPCEINYRTRRMWGRVAPPRRAATPRPVAICRDRGREERLPSTCRQQPRPCGFRSPESRFPHGAAAPKAPAPSGPGGQRLSSGSERVGRSSWALKAINTIWGIFNCSIKHAVNNYSQLR